MVTMERHELKAELRTVIGKQVNALRRQGKLPGVIYGFNVKPTPIVMDLREASNLLNKLPSSALVTVIVDGKEHNALVREKQIDYIRGTLRHVDFQVVSLRKKIRSQVPIEHTGTAPAVKEFEGILVSNMSQVEVEALPQDLPDRFLVDVSVLTEIGSAIYVRDLEAPKGVEILTDPDEVVFVITGSAPAVEEEEEATEGVEEPEVIERGKKEEEVED